MPRADPPEFRQRAIELAKQHDKPLHEIAEDLGAAPSCLRRWVAQADVDGGRAGAFSIRWTKAPLLSALNFRSSRTKADSFSNAATAPTRWGGRGQFDCLHTNPLSAGGAACRRNGLPSVRCFGAGPEAGCSNVPG
jgi:hypothetical protein